VVDTKGGRDGADTLTSIEKLNFGDVKAVDVTLDNPMPVKDVLTIGDRSGPKTISVAQLLANDRDWQGDALHITAISDVRGGTIAGVGANSEGPPTLSNGNLTFTPDASFTGVMSFKYRIADADGTPGANVVQIGTANQAEMRGQVFIKTPDMPTDGIFTDQWYLTDANVIPVWRDYTGKGVRIAQFEPSGPFAAGAREVFDYRHPDLQANVDPAFLSDFRDPALQAFSAHATLVAGVMVAARNDEGTVGVAYDATLAGYQVGNTIKVNSPSNVSVDFAELTRLREFDIANNSWAFAGGAENFAVVTPPFAASYFEPAAESGRHGLGTIIVAAGGNSRDSGGNTNYSEATNSRYVITTGAINAVGDISTLSIGQTPFSNPGASILLSAPGSNVASTSRILVNDQGSVFGADTETVQGTSFATPIISGVAALMLEANPSLGYRDVQEILAVSARKVNDTATDLVYNGARNWNGGGMHVSHDYGFGNVDALAAVRSAESWSVTHTAANERHLTQVEGRVGTVGTSLNLSIASSAPLLQKLTIGAGIRAEHVDVRVDLDHSNWGDLTIELISPTGTVSKLVSNPGTSASTPAGIVGQGHLTFTLDTTHSFGELAQGEWQLRVTDRAGGGTGTFNGWKLDVYGSDQNETLAGASTIGEAPVAATSGDDVYFYTNEFSTSPDPATPLPSRGTLTDTNGGVDTINAAAVSTSSTINLADGATSRIAGRDLVIHGDIESAYGGDGNDTINGNGLDNRLSGGRGDDVLSGGGGRDVLASFSGNDQLSGGVGADVFVIRKAPNSLVTLSDFDPASGDVIVLLGFDGIPASLLVPDVNTEIALGDQQKLRFLNIGGSQITSDQFVWSGQSALTNYWLGTAGDDFEDQSRASSAPGLYVAGAGADFVVGGSASDLMSGGDGNDFVDGNDGDDVLFGGGGVDRLRGGRGDDTLYLEGDDDPIDISGGAQGGIGSDRFVLRNIPSAVGGEARNVIQDLDYLNPREQIDLSEFPSITSGNQFLFSPTQLGFFHNHDAVRVYVEGTTSGQFITLYSVTEAQLRSNNFGSFRFYGAPASPVVPAGNPGVTGDAGGNTIDGTAGPDSMTGRTGDDTYIVNNGGDLVNELPGGGFDTVKSSISYALPADVENLALTGSANIDAAGNDQANRITGNSGNNVLDGRGGSDTMLGGAGNDTYLVDVGTDAVVENESEGADTVWSSVSYTLGQNIEHLTLTGVDAINATGNALSNVISGNPNDNRLDGGAGADSLAGGGGADTLRGGDGNDLLEGDAGPDSMDGGAGIDTASYETAAAGVAAYLSNPVLNSGDAAGDAYVSIEGLKGSQFDDALVGDAGANILLGLAGVDHITGGAGADTIDGGDGFDYARYDYSAAVTVDLMNPLAEAGDAAGDTFTGIEGVMGSAGDDLIYADNSGNDLSGLAGDDYINGRGGNDSLHGGDGNDNLEGGAGADSLSGEAGFDYVRYYLSSAVTVDLVSAGLNTGDAAGDSFSGIEGVIGSNTGADALYGDGGTNQIYGQGGNDYLAGRGGSDVLDGGEGNDVLEGGAGGDTLYGGAGIDTASYEMAAAGVAAYLSNPVLNSGDAAGDAYVSIEGLKGSQFDDALVGDAGANILLGLAGVDHITGGAGADTIDGGDGFDYARYDYSAAVTVDLMNPLAEAGDAAGDTFTGIEGVMGSAGDDLIYADNSGNDLSGLAGDDYINGRGGNDSLHGGDGNDNLEGGAGADSLSGEAGFDYVRYYLSSAVTVDLVSAGLNTGDAAGDSFSGIEGVIGSNTGADALYGDGGTNQIYGQGGNDYLAGRGGSDVLDGGEGNDVLEGGAGGRHSLWWERARHREIFSRKECLHGYQKRYDLYRCRLRRYRHADRDRAAAIQRRVDQPDAFAG
jgi:Ca2+-binding RTX toxin-like protein